MGLRDAHFFRKVPNDVTEATKVGGLISVLAVVTIFWLVRQEYAEFAAPKHVSVLSLDTSTLPSPLGAEAFENIRINFNITMLRMPCQYATLQIADHVGSHKVGGTRNVHKVMLDANGRSLGVYTPHRYHTEGPGAEPEHMTGGQTRSAMLQAQFPPQPRRLRNLLSACIAGALISLIRLLSCSSSLSVKTSDCIVFGREIKKLLTKYNCTGNDQKDGFRGNSQQRRIHG